MEQERAAAGRVLALDPGRVRTGIALSDPDRTLATPLETVALPLARLIAHVAELVRRHRVTDVVIGLPRLPSGDEGEIAGLSHRLADGLAREPGLRVHLRDETLTSWEAQELLAGRSRRRGKQEKGEVDRVAAALLLQEYLNELARAAVLADAPNGADPKEGQDE